MSGFSSFAIPNANLAQVATSTIKGRTTAGTGTPEDLTAAQAAAIIGGVGGAVLTKTLNFTYDLSTASSTVSYTGFGFNPTAVMLHYCINGAAGGGNGYMSGGLQGSSGMSTDNALVWWRQVNQVALIGNAALSAYQQGVGSFISDGIQIVWTKAGSPTGTLGITIIGFR
jgi:hypothetical protein